MKIALIGNMNNNHFSMMRYFHDLGVEAHLFKFANESDHFQPECDTWQIEKYQKYIHETNIINGDISQYFKLKRKELYDIFKGYDYYIGCGFTPAYFNKAGLKLDILIPYGVGIEFTFRVFKFSIFDHIKEKVVRLIQANGIKKSVKVIATVDKETTEKAAYYGIPTEKLAVPMVYNEQTAEHTDYTLPVKNAIASLSKHDFVAFSHVSHFPPNTRSYFDKRNDIFINGFAHFLTINTQAQNPVLVLLEYGEYVNGSKELIKQLGIENKVIWLPLMMRKELMKVLELATVGGGEFGGLFWGGTGWEFLCKGIPFFHYLNMNNEQFRQLTDFEKPLLFDMNEPKQIGERMNQLLNERNAGEIGLSLKNWYDTHSGKELARKYIELLKTLNN